MSSSLLASAGQGRERLRRFRTSHTVSLLVVLLSGCSTNMNIVEEHEAICKKNMQVIVHDGNLWREYQKQSEIAHQREMAAEYPIAWRALYFPVGNFTIAFGEGKSFFRSSGTKKIYRDDVFVMKNDVIVAQIVDYITQIRGFDGPTDFSCLKFYDNLVLGERK